MFRCLSWKARRLCLKGSRYATDHCWLNLDCEVKAILTLDAPGLRQSHDEHRQQSSLLMVEKAQQRLGRRPENRKVRDLAERHCVFCKRRNATLHPIHRIQCSLLAKPLLPFDQAKADPIEVLLRQTVHLRLQKPFPVFANERPRQRIVLQQH